MQHIYKGRFVDDTTFVDEFGNEYTLQTSDFGGVSDDSNKGNNQEGDSQSEGNEQDNDAQNNDNPQDSNSQQDSNSDSGGDDNNQSQDDDDLIEPEVGALFDDVMTGKQYRWNGNDFEEV